MISSIDSTMPRNIRYKAMDSSFEPNACFHPSPRDRNDEDDGVFASPLDGGIDGAGGGAGAGAMMPIVMEGGVGSSSEER